MVSKKLFSVKVEEETSVVALDLIVEGIVTCILEGWEEIWGDQGVVQAFVSSLVGIVSLGLSESDGKCISQFAVCR